MTKRTPIFTGMEVEDADDAGPTSLPGNGPPAWFRDLMRGSESLSLDSEADRNTLWMNLESMLSGMRTRRVNDLMTPEGRARAYEFEKARAPYHNYIGEDSDAN